mgnify:CR=1 FL=1
MSDLSDKITVLARHGSVKMDADLIGISKEVVALEAENERMRSALLWIDGRACANALLGGLDLPYRQHVEAAYDMNVCAHAALTSEEQIDG